MSFLILCGTAEAAWYWPFGGNKEQPKLRVSELMEPVSELIDEASDLASEGKLEESVDKYREALFTIDRIELENADRAQSAAFATIRNKRAYVNAAIDSLLLRQAQQSARAVAVTDTTELEKRFEAMKRAEKERAAKAKEQEQPKVSEKPEVPAMEPEKPEPAAAEPENPEPTAAEPENPGKPENPEPVVEPAEPQKPAVSAVRPGQPQPDTALAQSDRRARLLLVAADIKCGKYDAALSSIQRLLAERPNDPAALNLRAAVETEKGEYDKAEQTLDQSIRNNPKNHFAYYNMARLILKTRGERGREAARGYYEAGRVRGGPEDKGLEAAL